MKGIAGPTHDPTRLILIGAALLLSLGMGLRQSFGLFLTPMTRDLAITASSFALAIAVQNVMWGVSQAPIGALADRFGLRVTMLASLPFEAILLSMLLEAMKAIQHLEDEVRDARAALLRGQANLQVLEDREVAVHRRRLRDVADSPPELR